LVRHIQVGDEDVGLSLGGAQMFKGNGAVTDVAQSSYPSNESMIRAIRESSSVRRIRRSQN